MARTTKDTLVSWLKDAHAMKAARMQNLERQAERYDEYPELKSKLSEHIGHSRAQTDELERYLKQLGADTSAMKEGVSRIASELQHWTTSSAPDQVVKNLIANDAFAEFEAASFHSLSVAARESGETQIAEGCERMRDEERRMADWFQSEVPRVTERYLQRHGAAAH